MQAQAERRRNISGETGSCELTGRAGMGIAAACIQHIITQTTVIIWRRHMATKTAPAVSPEEHAKRKQLAKALYFTELGDAKPTDGKEAQAAFDAVKKEMIRKAIKLNKTLARMGYEITPIA